MDNLLENELDDDNMIIIIVGDDEKDLSDREPIACDSVVKIENTDEFVQNVIEEYNVQDVMESVVKHGHFYKVKVEPIGEENTWEQLGDEFADLRETVKVEFDADDNEQQVEPSEDAWTEDYTNYENTESIEDYNDNYVENVVPDYKENYEDPDDPDFKVENEDFSDEDQSSITSEYVDYNNEQTNKLGPSRSRLLKPDEQRSLVKELREQYPDLRNNKMLINAISEIMNSIIPPVAPKGSYLPEGKQFICQTCRTETESKKAAERHYREKHGPRYLVCLACGVDFRSLGNLYRHEKVCISPDAPLVLKARASVLGSKARSRPYINHFKHQPPKVQKRSQPRFQCPECPASFSVQRSLESHINLHRGYRPYLCKYCPAAYTSQSGLCRHERRHANKQYICDHCGRSFKLKDNLIPHLGTHDLYPKSKCDQCGREYSQSAALKRHIRKVHMKLPPPCACAVCPKRFNRMNELKLHMLKKHQLNIMTKQAFFHKMPTLSDDEMKKYAKVVLQKDIDTLSFNP